ncbi:D-alanine-D-alanine ligase [Paenibacillus sp. ov031]|uniref:ATP-grasp domain-containing protein n=1 Tax=Paenibacillus sp. ov031 TaxID=1761879 RepID=UPI000911072A|nr:ATP-grasp domain-containing protein [Paenibacillus sp. ov031]SHN54759.1 D-alanine-D-alanine ligase [Paenibacillus sp. ov031]
MESHSRLYEELNDLISFSESYNGKYTVVFINGNKSYTKANSGYLEEIEALEINKGFENSSENYTFYNNPSTFVGDIILNNLPTSNSHKILLYSTAQIGIDINRRSFIPNFSSLHNIHNLTCDGYTLALLQNKMHYYDIAKNYVNVPQTFVYTNQNFEIFESMKNNNYIVKPSYECSAKGVNLVKDRKNLKEVVINLYYEFQQPILIQEFITGTEIEVPVIIKNMRPVPLLPVEIKKDKSFLSVEEVDSNKYGFELIKDAKQINKLQTSVKKLMSALQADGLCRVDFIVDEKGEPWLFDIAALPLISSHSSCYTVFRELYPNDPYALYKALIGIKLINQSAQYSMLEKSPSLK